VTERLGSDVGRAREWPLRLGEEPAVVGKRPVEVPPDRVAEKADFIGFEHGGRNGSVGGASSSPASSAPRRARSTASDSSGLMLSRFAMPRGNLRPTTLVSAFGRRNHSSSRARVTGGRRDRGLKEGSSPPLGVVEVTTPNGRSQVLALPPGSAIGARLRDVDAARATAGVATSFSRAGRQPHVRAVVGTAENQLEKLIGTDGELIDDAQQLEHAVRRPGDTAGRRSARTGSLAELVIPFGVLGACETKLLLIVSAPGSMASSSVRNCLPRV